MKKLLYIICICSFFLSCSVDTTITFNDDFSGKINNKIDFTDFFAEVTELNMDEEVPDSINIDSIMFEAKREFIEEIIPGMIGASDFSQEVEELEGISNLKLDVDTLNTSISVDFSFTDLKTLNNYFIKSAEKDYTLYEFYKKNKTISFTFKKDDSSDPMMGALADKLKEKLILVFPHTIKSCSVEEAMVYGYTDNIISFNVGDLEQNKTVKIKLK